MTTVTSLDFCAKQVWGKGELALVALTRISTQAFQEKSL